MPFTLAGCFLFLQCQLKGGISDGLVDIKLGERGCQTRVVFNGLNIMAVRSAFLVEGMIVPLLCGRLPFQPCPAACRRDSGGRLPPHLPRAPSRREVARRTGGLGWRGGRGVRGWWSRWRGRLFGEGSGCKAPVLGWRSAGDAGVWLTLEGELFLRHGQGRRSGGRASKELVGTSG